MRPQLIGASESIIDRFGEATGIDVGQTAANGFDYPRFIRRILTLSGNVFLECRLAAKYIATAPNGIAPIKATGGS